MANTSSDLTTLLAVAFPLIGIGLSAWSFKFSEAAEPPDPWPGDYSYEPRERTILDRRARERARTCAKLLFNAGAWVLAAGVPMGTADGHGAGPLSPLGIVAYLVVAGVAIYAFQKTREIWQHRRETAYQSFDLGRQAWQLHRESGALRRLFFSMNPMPYISVFRREWESSLRYPDAEAVAALPHDPTSPL